MMPIFALGAALILAIAALSTALGAFFTVDQSERGVLLRNGAYVDTVGPGLHFKMPWIDSVRDVSVQTQTRRYDKLNSYSADQQPADVRLSVTYHLETSRIGDAYSRFGWPVHEAIVNRLIDPRVSQEFKVVFGRFTAAQAIQDRARLNTDAYKAISAALAGNPEVVLEGVQVEDIEFSGQYIQSIEARMQAEIEVQKVQQNAQREKVNAEITVIKAQANADSLLAQAKADAQATQVRGEAEANAIKVKGDALKDNPGLVALTQAERWDGHLPVTMVPGATVPFLNVK